MHNEDLAKEIVAGGQDSIINLRTTHEGLKRQERGYDYRMTADDQNRFSGTAWQTGRMRARIRHSGKLAFLDDSRSGISTSGFCFWNIMILNQDRKSQTIMGAMTMCASQPAAYWVLTSMVAMAPHARNIIEATMSDLGELNVFHLQYYQLCSSIYISYSTAPPSAPAILSTVLLRLLSYFCNLPFRCNHRNNNKGSAKCQLLWCLHLAHNDHRLPKSSQPHCGLH